ncbi:hypothetical protein BD410DRAFT_902753 [Rickenella mellea]|uniref:Uncharacterized protein n=1 Tax=Rickenella mellea TaxID=50990 RepID=A0A4Y7PI04_9AGAM|nr:hypothetical protein BD410DRAFT_902753 [Rickenella mellea]
MANSLKASPIQRLHINIFHLFSQNMRSSLFAATVLAAASGIHALTAQCQSALLSIAGSPDARCLNIAGIVPFIGMSSNASLAEPITNWLSGFCSGAPCSNQTLQTLAANLTTGCDAVQAAHPLLRNVACSKDARTKTSCITSTLNAAEKASGTLTLSNALQFLPGLVTGSSTGTKKVACADCVKAAFNNFNRVEPALLKSAQVNSAFSTARGASFLDGKAPSSVV